MFPNDLIFNVSKWNDKMGLISCIYYKIAFSTIEDEEVLQLSAALPFLGNEILFLCIAANFCHFLAILMSFLALSNAIFFLLED